MALRIRLVPLVAVVVAVAAGGASAASAKDFRPGELRVCDRARCVPVVKPSAVALLGPFYYGTGRLAVVPRPRLGAPSFELRFRSGYVTGIIGGPKLDRFLTYGVHDGRFLPHTWYRLPRQLQRELRSLTAGLRPIRITRASLARSR